MRVTPLWFTQSRCAACASVGPMGGSGVRVRVLGPIQAVWPDGTAVDPGSVTQRRILAALAITPRRPVRVEALTEIAGLTSGALRVSISRLRRLLGADAISTGPVGYCLDLDTDAALAVAALSAAGRDLPSLEAALGDWRGAPFAEFATEPWAAPEQARLAELHALAIEDRAEALFESGRIGEAVAELRAHICANQWRDRPRGLLVRALAASGRTREALQSYHEYRTTLVEESGIEPSHELQHIEHRVAGGWDGRDARARRVHGVAVRGAPPRQSVAAALIGRQAELAKLVGSLADVTAQCRLGSVVVVGDAGIGKTSLLRAFAESVNSSAMVVQARCDEAVSVPLQPFRTVVDRLVTEADNGLVLAHVGAHDRILALMTPALARRIGPDGPHSRNGSFGADDATARFLLFEAVADVIRRNAEHRPLVLLLDDLHWAEPTALQLLRHVIRAASDARVLLVASTRDPDESASPELRSALADLACAPSVRIELGGLGRSPLAELVRSMSSDVFDQINPDTVDPEVVEELVTDTAGNPLFATHLVRHWLDTGRFDGSGQTIRFAASPSAHGPLPATLRDIVWARLRSLGPDAPEVLSAATFLGHDISESSLIELADATPEVVASVLDSAARAGIVTENQGHAGTVRFTHALVAHAVEADLPAPRRRRLHERAARSLERTGGRSASTLTRIAYHWDRAASPTEALRSALDAGDAALLSLAGDEAVHWYRRALSHTDALGSTDAVRAAVLVQLGTGLQRAGDASALDTLMQAAELARRCGDHHTLVQAAEATGRGFVRLGDFAPTYQGLVDEALAVTPLEDVTTRARLLAMLGAALMSSGDADRRERAALDALALADVSDDPLLIARLAPEILCALWTPVTATLRAEISGRAVTAAAASGDPYLRFVVNLAAFNTAVSLGDAKRAMVTLAAIHEVVEAHAEPRMRWTLSVIDTFGATMAGRFQEAERLAQASAELGMALGEADAFSIFASQFYVIGTFAGRYAELLPLVDQVLASGETAMPFRLAHAIACAASGRRDEAAAVLDAGRVGGFAAVPQDMLWLTSIVGYAVLAIELGDRGAAADLFPLLEPYSGQVAFNGATSQGPVAAYLGRLASLLGRYDEADRFLNAALSTAAAFGWEYHRASTLVCLAESQLRRTGTIDLHAGRLLDEAQQACEEHSIGWWADRIRSLRGTAAP